MQMSMTFIDHASREFLDAWQRQHEADGGTVTIELEHPGTADQHRPRAQAQIVNSMSPL
jgi:hypothetical protein